LNSSKTVRCEHYFHSSKTALAALAKAPSPPTVILLDIKMPVVSGIDSIIPIKEYSPHSIIMMLTSYDDDKNIQLALERGASGYLLKTSTPEDIIRAVEKVQQGGSPLDPMITKKIMSLILGSRKKIRNSSKLSKRELEIVNLIAKGSSSKKIAENINLSFYTVNTHLRNIYHKLNVNSRHMLVAKAYDDGLVRQ
jgi:DNA-binding NarL/FixJ family response regulator